MTSNAPINYILANQWSHRSHGHGQAELTLIKNLLLESDHNAVILSTAADFGDYFIDSKVNWVSKIPTKFQRGFFFREKNQFAIRSQCESWVYALNHLSESFLTPTTLLVTSSSFLEVAFLLNHLQYPNQLLCRITHFDESFLNSKKNSDLILSCLTNGRLKLAVETCDAAESFKNITGRDVQVVLPAQGLMRARSRNLGSDKTLGLLWPLTSYASVSEVETFLNALPQDVQVCIRLPHRISKEELSVSSDSWRFLGHGISHLEYSDQIQGLDFVLLPHNGYIRKGSGLAFEFISLGIPILTHYANAFIRDIPPTNLLHTFQDFSVDSIRQGIRNVFASEIVDSQTEAGKIRDYVVKTWKNFLG